MTETTALARPNGAIQQAEGSGISAQTMELVLQGDLSKLTSAQRVEYYIARCSAAGLDPRTKPFDYLSLSGKMVLYANATAAQQAAEKRHLSLQIVRTERIEDVYCVTCRVTDPDGRFSESVGAVTLGNLRGDGLANVLMKAECVPLDSEILTRNGFKTYDALEIGEEVLAYDVARDLTVWTPLLRVSVFEDAPVCRLRSDNGQFGITCTPEHTWAVRRGKEYAPAPHSGGSRGPRGPYRSRQPLRQLVKALDLKTSHSIILSAPEADVSEESLLDPHEAVILAWAVTDGTIKRVGNSVRIGICQSKERNFEEIRQAVEAVAPGAKEFVSPARERLFPSSGRTYATKEQHWWYVPAATSRALLEKCGFKSRADLPRIAARLSSNARKVMAGAMMTAEGDARGVFANGDPYVLEAFEILCALEGIATGQETAHAGIKTVRMKKTRHVACSFLELEPSGRADVWCPTTAPGTWIMRQGGRVMITGNTKAKRRAVLSFCGLGMLDESETETIPGAQRVRVDVSTGEIQERVTQAAETRESFSGSSGAASPTDSRGQAAPAAQDGAQDAQQALSALQAEWKRQFGDSAYAGPEHLQGYIERMLCRKLTPKSDLAGRGADLAAVLTDLRRRPAALQALCIASQAAGMGTNGDEAENHRAWLAGLLDVQLPSRSLYTAAQCETARAEVESWQDTGGEEPVIVAEVDPFEGQ